MLLAGLAAWGDFLHSSQGISVTCLPPCLCAGHPVLSSGVQNTRTKSPLIQHSHLKGLSSRVSTLYLHEFDDNAQ